MQGVKESERWSVGGVRVLRVVGLEDESRRTEIVIPIRLSC